MSRADDLLQRQYDQAEAAKARRATFIKKLNSYFGIGPGVSTAAPPVNALGAPAGVLPGTPAYAAWLQSLINPAGTVASGNPYKDKLNRVYDRVGKNVRNFYQQDLDEQRLKNRRELTFELSRRGQLGSSDDLDQNLELDKLYSKGAVQIANRGLQARQDAQGRDEQTRLSAIRDINADIDGTSAIQSALIQQGQNAQAASDFAQGQQLGDQFQNLTYLYGLKRNKDQSDTFLRNYGAAQTSASTVNRGTLRGGS